LQYCHKKYKNKWASISISHILKTSCIQLHYCFRCKLFNILRVLIFVDWTKFAITPPLCFTYLALSSFFFSPFAFLFIHFLPLFLIFVSLFIPSYISDISVWKLRPCSQYMEVTRSLSHICIYNVNVKHKSWRVARKS